jgi:hypothetical protein
MKNTEFFLNDVINYNDTYSDYFIVKLRSTNNYKLVDLNFDDIDTLEFPSIDGLIAYYENLTSDQYDENFDSEAIDTQK